jgi:hypothetical protein
MHRRSCIAVALAAVALVAPAAQARIDPPINTFTEEEQQALAARGQGAPEGRLSPATTAPRVQSSDPGFDWGSAAVGAGAGAGVLALLTLGGLSVGERRRLRVARG